MFEPMPPMIFETKRARTPSEYELIRAEMAANLLPKRNPLGALIVKLIRTVR
jgi:hypothetical protein